MLPSITFRWLLSTILWRICIVEASYYDPSEEAWNLNTNQHASTPLEYSISWPNHTYHESPKNWRMPFYSFFLDRFVNGDPSNDNANDTSWEHDHLGTQLRHGGDMRGLVDSLDYLHGLGIRGLYIAGSMLLNFPWSADGYSPVDHTILDHHFGTLQEVREAIQAIHDHGMYVILDNTMATMSDLFAFQGFFNSSAPWSFVEHDMLYKSDRRYRDFHFSNDFHPVCEYPFPDFYDQAGHLIRDENTTQMIGCMDSEFDQFGEVGAFGVYPEWQKQLSKFNGVQDRLRDWNPSVLDKIKHFSCMMIHGLDIDGFRIDKAMQVTVEAQGNFSAAMRDCAAQVGKKNFFIPGEIVNGNRNGAIYIGRGKGPEMGNKNLTEVVTSNELATIRPRGMSALDAGAFHYTTYRALMRLLGLDGNLIAAHDAPVNFADQWNIMIETNDLNNAYTGQFDPRHMYGASNQDVLRWPGMSNGTERQLLADFIVTLLMPGIPMINWGEEQAFYTLDSTASNYVYGRQAMSSAQAWQMHGCYKVGTINLNNAPFNSSLTACQDPGVSLDHRDPSHPVYGLRKQMFELRERYPVLNDGWYVRQLSNHTFNYTLPGSFEVPTETGMYSIYRSAWHGVQNLTGQGMFGDQSIWLLYSNYNGSINYTADCRNVMEAIVAPFSQGTAIKNLFYPFDEWVLQSSKFTFELEGSKEPNGCLPMLNMTMYGWKAFVPRDKWTKPSPVITKFWPGHDARILSNTSIEQPSAIDIELRFSDLMDCDSVTRGISIVSRTDFEQDAKLDTASVQCQTVDPLYEAHFYGPSPSVWRYRATIRNAYDGVHRLTVNNVSSQDRSMFTGSRDHFLLRIGQPDNVMVFPFSANYSSSLLHRHNVARRDTKIESSDVFVHHRASGADKWRYSMSFGGAWSEWFDYNSGNVTLPSQTWQGSDEQAWRGEHVQVQYWSALTGSSDHHQEGDLVGSISPPRRFPHFFIHGSFNQYGYDSGVPNDMLQLDNGTWAFDFMAEWPTQFQLNVWGMAADGTPDVSHAFGDVDNDTVLERINPTSLQPAVVNITDYGPPAPFLAWRILFNDADMRYYLVPVGNRWVQLTLWLLLALLPITTGILGILSYVGAFYGVKLNKVGLTQRKRFWAFTRALHSRQASSDDEKQAIPPDYGVDGVLRRPHSRGSAESSVVNGATVERGRRMVLIGTMEYDIPDWNIKIKIGGLGVMAQLMGKNLDHQDIVWVVPCVGGIDYPEDTPGLPISVTILGMSYQIQVQYHMVDNITYMLCDAPVFRRQTQTNPYPARMDDLDSAIYYSVWNQCIAEAMRRFPIDLYHINDYHGTVAPLYMLPDTIPCCLSLHNAEFQGLWPMRTPQEVKEICGIFNLPLAIVARYVQFGEVFNLLHAGASILRIHQKGFGAVGVSRKYGKRSWARYPIFWGLKRIGALPNPDPSDIAEWDKKLVDPNDVTIDADFELSRAELKLQAQRWAGLKLDADADLFVFVGRWSMQKGIDLIADVFPAILEKHDKTQLICIGPTIDLYGRFAALKLEKMMEKYHGRVYSKPEFTALPAYIFSGAEFALIPSRDEPFGLVAVEFGRKGALGVGSRVGGLGQMPGWWYTIESTTTKHQMQQFKMAIAGALKSDYGTRAIMRARSAKQRFPVAQWKEDLEILQSTSIKVHRQQMVRMRNKRLGIDSGTTTPSGWMTPNLPGWMSPRSGRTTPTGYSTPSGSRPGTRPSSPNRSSTTQCSPNESKEGSLSLGLRHGPGHVSSSDTPPSASHSFSNWRTLASVTRLSDRTPSEGSSEVGRGRLSSVDDSEEYITAEQAEEGKRQARLAGITQESFTTDLRDGTGHVQSYLRPAPSYCLSPGSTPGIATPNSDSWPFPARGQSPERNYVPPTSAAASVELIDEQTDEKFQQDLTPFFTDPTGLYAKTFEKMLTGLSGKTSEAQLCIEQYLSKSEKDWFNRLHAARMLRAPTNTSQAQSNAGSIYAGSDPDEPMSQFLLPENYTPPSGVRRLLSYKLGDWPLYTLLLALGQILAANSYQITLLTGQQGQTATQLYVVASIYLTSSLIWWCVFRRFESVYTLSVPWVFYGLAFFLLAFAPYAATVAGRGWVQNVATAMYAIASASGSLFFAQNFGSQGAAPVESWAFRACAIQGTQQIYLVGLWFWGSELTRSNTRGLGAAAQRTYGWPMTAIGVPVAFLLWTIGLVLYFGLPDFYRQKPGGMPSFYTSVFRRRIIVWFFVATFVQNFFLSAPYGRNWAYLWSSQHAPAWTIVLLIILFFVIVWAVILLIFGRLSKVHSWILPMFAVALGAPRWAQIWWAVSNMGAYVPWAGGPIASAIAGRSLWLWLGVLDSMQGVGIGMLLLQTLTRFHISFALIFAQVVGSIGTIIARADGLSSVGPLPYFPSPAAGVSNVVGYAGFWVCLVFQILICVGYFAYFRKEQLSKP